jgi:hypothetical protein
MIEQPVKSEAQTQQEVKQFYLVFNGGCQNAKCLSLQCKNFVFPNEALEKIRQSEQTSFVHVVEEYQKNSFKNLFCQSPRKSCEHLEETLKSKFSFIIGFDLIKTFNLSQNDQHQAFNLFHQ